MKSWKSDFFSTKWKSLNKFPNKSVRSLPFTTDANTIMYCTNYDSNSNNDNSGIYEYDIKKDQHKIIQLWKNTPTFTYIKANATIYNRTHDTIIFVGGYNGKYTTKYKFSYTEKIFIYNMKSNTMKDIDLKIIIGETPKLALSNNDQYLHIIGGGQSNMHFIYDLSTNKIKNIHRFDFKIGEHAAIHNKLTNTIIMFGGYSFELVQNFDHFWTIDLNNKFSVLSIYEGSRYLVNCYIDMVICYENKTHYPISLIDVIARYFDINVVSPWKMNKTRKMKTKLSAFGYVLYDNRIIITFGGETTRGLTDSIYYIDLLGKCSWKESKVKCKKQGACHALLINNKMIHIIPFVDYDNHYVIDVAHLLPSNLLKH